MEELLAEIGEPMTEADYRGRRERLMLAFQGQGIETWEAVEKAIRTHSIDESPLVEEWLERRAFERVMPKLSRIPKIP